MKECVKILLVRECTSSSFDYISRLDIVRCYCTHIKTVSHRSKCFTSIWNESTRCLKVLIQFQWNNTRSSNRPRHTYTYGHTNTQKLNSILFLKLRSQALFVVLVSFSFHVEREIEIIDRSYVALYRCIVISEIYLSTCSDSINYRSNFDHWTFCVIPLNLVILFYIYIYIFKKKERSVFFFFFFLYFIIVKEGDLCACISGLSFEERE